MRRTWRSPKKRGPERKQQNFAEFARSRVILQRTADKDPRNLEGRRDLREGLESREARMGLGGRIGLATLVGNLDILLEIAITDLLSSPPKKRMMGERGNMMVVMDLVVSHPGTPRVRNLTRIATLMKVEVT
jgi:hypothetical protein